MRNARWRKTPILMFYRHFFELARLSKPIALNNGFANAGTEDRLSNLLGLPGNFPKMICITGGNKTPPLGHGS